MNNRRTLDERARVCVLQVHPRSLAAYNCVSIQKKQIKRVKGGDYYYYYYHYSRKVEAEKAAQPNSSAKINRVREWKKREREREEPRKDFWHAPWDALPIGTIAQLTEIWQHYTRNGISIMLSRCVNVNEFSSIFDYNFCVELTCNRRKRNRYAEESRFLSSSPLPS